MQSVQSQKGFSLVGVMVAAGLLGGLSLVMMSLSKNMSNVQSSGQSSFEEQELLSMVRMILSTENFCRMSLAVDNANNPVKFFKTQLDGDNLAEGWNVELWTSDSAGLARTSRRVFPGLVQGKVEVTKIVFTTPNPTVPAGGNYPEGLGVDMAQLSLGYIKRSGSNTREMVANFPFMIGVSTATGGESTFLTCHR